MAYDTELDSIGLTGTPAPIVLPPGRRGDQFSSMQASDAEIGTAVGQLNAGQPVTALPRQEWSPAQGQAFVARLNQFDQQAKAARMAAEQAALDAQMLQQMSRVAKSTKDIEIARRNIDVMGLQRDIQNGVPIHQAVARHPMGLGSGFAGALRATAPPGKASWVAPSGGAPGHFQLPSGGVSVPPASAMGAEPLSTQAEPITDPSGRVLGYRAATGPRTGSIMDRAPAAGSMPAEKRLTIDALRDELNVVEKAIADNSVFANTASVKPKLEAWNKRREELRQQLSEFLPQAYPKVAPPAGTTGRINPMPSKKADLVAGQIYDTPRGAATWDGNKFKLVEKR